MPKAPSFLTKDADWQFVGGLSMPSKMPGYAYSLPAADCVTGGKLRAVSGSTCSHCYAFRRGNYRFPSVQRCLEKRLESLTDLDTWAKAMIRLIPKAVAIGDPYFRWHDSGDIQSTLHLAAIVMIADKLPMIRFWLPTREFRFVKQWLEAGGLVPRNLTIRLSAALVGVRPALRPELENLGLQSSSVGAFSGAICGARTRGNECGPCRACWSKEIGNVDYPLH